MVVEDLESRCTAGFGARMSKNARLKGSQIIASYGRDIAMCMTWAGFIVASLQEDNMLHFLSKTEDMQWEGCTKKRKIVTGF